MADFFRFALIQVSLLIAAVIVSRFFNGAQVFIGISTIIAFTFWSAYRLVFPISRLLLKSQAQFGNSSKEDFQENAFGEWSDLESNIDDLKKNLERASQNLTMEQVELDTVMGAISDAILAVDLEGVPIFYNSRFEVVFGGGTIRRNIKLWEILRDPEILGTYKGALKQGKVGTTHSFPYHYGGTKRYFSLSVSPLRKHGGIIYGALGIFHDITELKIAEKMRIDFVANVSHELRTPLTAIKGYTETLQQDLEVRPGDLTATSTKEFLGIISRNAARLMNLMEDLLDLSSIESTTVLQKDNLGTFEITQRVVKNLQERFLKKKQIIDFSAEAKTVVADPNRLEQILTNLLDNAYKYTPEGGKISVHWEADRNGGKDVFLKVVDSGPGISLEHQGRLFERFYRVDKARSREQGGTGLGLAIVKHIMQRHEGAVWIESQAGKGSTFVCRFPE